ncbi:C-terminal binding protein [Frondihabitans sucicola]|uniref:C-terminal binding protein n=1 Tax=Frondihabitans sucicola TaxID=1268041 RepID=UPI002572D579|nr:C-terminal binding protein [Frondihabitans sucicola]
MQTSPRVQPTPEQLAWFREQGIEFSVIDGSTEESLVAGAQGADGLVVVMENITRSVLEQLPTVRSAVRFGIGFDTIDVDAAAELGVQVSNVPDANYREVAVHALSMALTLTRRLPAWDRAVKQDGWADMSVGSGIHRPDDQVFGLIGLGRIGGRVAAAAKTIGYRVQAFDPYTTPERATELGVDLVSLDDVISTSDVLSLHVPLTPETRSMIDADALARMPRGSVLVNVSRGGLVDEQALAEALGRGHLAGAGIDVFAREPLGASPLRSIDTALLSPHAAHLSAESFDETRQKAYDEVVRVAGGGVPRSPVNSPATRSAGPRTARQPFQNS